MSVINSMLRDLDRRRVEVGSEAAYQHVRVIAPAARWERGAPFVLGVVVLATGLGWFAYQQWAAGRGGEAVTAQSSVRTDPVLTVRPASVLPQASESERGLSLAVSRQLQASTPPEIPAPPVAQVAPLVAPATVALPAAPAPVPAVTTSPARGAAPVDEKGTVRAGDRAGPVGTEPSSPVAMRDRVSPGPANTSPSPAAPAHEAVKQVSANQRADNEFRFASEHFNKGQMSQAIEGFSRALAADPRHDAARQSLVGVLLNARRAAEAERILSERLAMAPDHAGFATILARLQAERGDAEGALATLGATLPWATGNAPYHATMAALHARVGQHGQAITHYQAALRLAPNAGVWWMGLGLSFQAAGRNAEAVEALQRARNGENISADLVAYVEQKIRQLQ